MDSGLQGKMKAENNPSQNQLYKQGVGENRGWGLAVAEIPQWGRADLASGVFQDRSMAARWETQLQIPSGGRRPRGGSEVQLVTGAWTAGVEWIWKGKPGRHEAGRLCVRRQTCPWQPEAW